jgi:hypothetical protein
MFNGCTNLVSIPELSATTLAQSACDSLFRKCTSLVDASELHITTVSQDSC